MSYLPRLGALVAASALAVTGVTLVATPAQAVTEPRPVAQGAAWLESQLVDGILQGDFGALYGPSIDAALVLSEIGGHDDTVTTIANAIRNHYYDYVTGGIYGPNDFYAGTVAKALVLAQVADTNPTVYRSNAQTDLEGLVVGTGVNTGRIKNTGMYPDTNVISQSFAARALTVAGSTKAADVTSFLLNQQCAAGFFRENPSAEAAVTQTCDADLGKPAIDTTAIAVQNLAAIPSPSVAVTTAITTARAWLTSHQNTDHSWGVDEDGNPAGNANATGLAVRALGDTAASATGAGWLRDHQVNDTDACTKLKASIGAIAFNDAALTAGRADGITSATSQQWRLAAAQTLSALEFLPTPAAATLNVTGPTGYNQAGKAAAYKVTGATAGSTLCVSTTGAAKLGIATGAGTATVSPVLPAGTATRTITVTDRDGNTDTVTTKVLGTKTLTVKATPTKVKQNGTVTVVVSGLAPYEKVVVRFRGEVADFGTASKTGKFVTGGPVGKTLGTAGIAAIGQFPTIRKGSTTIKVVK